MTVKKARGYYYYAERGGTDSIAFILYDARTGFFGLISESKPPLDEAFNELHMRITAFGGSLDIDGLSPAEICQIEVKEEAGFDVPMEKIMCIGTTMVSTQMNQGCVGYIVDVTGIIPGKTETDYKREDAEQLEKDPYEFSDNRVVWLTDEEIMVNNDWKSIWIFAKAYHASLQDKLDEAKEQTQADINSGKAYENIERTGEQND
jgi:hypothetical protein